jgi:hypothetical protein
MTSSKFPNLFIFSIKNFGSPRIFICECLYFNCNQINLLVISARSFKGIRVSISFWKDYNQISTRSTPLGIHPWRQQSFARTWNLSLGCLDPWGTPTWSIPSYQPCAHSLLWNQKESKEVITHGRRKSSRRLRNLSHSRSLDWFGSTELWLQCLLLRWQSWILYSNLIQDGE